MTKLKRRDFLRVIGLTGATAVAGCSPDATKKLIPYLIPEDDIVPGMATWYASTCRECPAGCGILAKNREGRVIKVEGNPLHPINQGRICMRGQAAVQGIYNPDRIKSPLLKEKDGWRALSFSDAENLLRSRIKEAADKGPNRIRMLTEVVGDTLLHLFTRSLNQWDSTNPMVFETFAYESLKTANEKVFGVKGLPSYHMEKADLLVSFGADFLETWLSPVEYARKFKEMHSLHDGKKGFFVHISPYQSLTGANSDLWISCNPGKEAAIALGILREALSYDDRGRLPDIISKPLKRATYPFTREKVIEVSGIASDHYENLLRVLIKSEKPLILGRGVSALDTAALQTEMVVLLLNVVLDPELKLFDFTDRHRIEIAARRAEILAFFKSVKNDPLDLLLLNNVNPVFLSPPEAGWKKR
jgi:Anaerobic dehydrogenases, typically selenocysteine-containing